jgi:hypothetical protein
MSEKDRCQACLSALASFYDSASALVGVIGQMSKKDSKVILRAVAEDLEEMKKYTCFSEEDVRYADNMVGIIDMDIEMEEWKIAGYESRRLRENILYATLEHLRGFCREYPTESATE